MTNKGVSGVSPVSQSSIGCLVLLGQVWDAPEILLLNVLWVSQVTQVSHPPFPRHCVTKSCVEV